MEESKRETGAQRWSLGAECVLLFIGIPALLSSPSLHLPNLAMLLLGALYCLAMLRHDATFSLRRLWATRASSRLWLAMLLRVSVFYLLLWLTVAVFAPERLWAWPLRAPQLWGMTLLIYPFFSAYPQELVYRAFFLHRYRPILPNTRWRVAASVLLFAYLHVIYGNPLAVGLSLLGGIVLTYTYLRSRSLIITAIEHTLYGLGIFTIGLGSYFA